MENQDEGASYEEASVPVWHADGAYIRVRPDVSSIVFFQDIPKGNVSKGHFGIEPTDRRKIVLDVRIPSVDLLGALFQFLIGIGILGRIGVKFPGFKIEPDSSLTGAISQYEKENPSVDFAQKMRQRGVWVGGPNYHFWAGKRQNESFTITMEGTESDGKSDPMQ